MLTTENRKLLVELLQQVVREDKVLEPTFMLHAVVQLVEQIDGVRRVAADWKESAQLMRKDVDLEGHADGLERCAEDVLRILEPQLDGLRALIERSSVGQGLKRMKEDPEAELAQLEGELDNLDMSVFAEIEADPPITPAGNVPAWIAALAEDWREDARCRSDLRAARERVKCADEMITQAKLQP